MASLVSEPGPAANRAFRHGIAAAAFLALAILAASYWAGFLGARHVGFALVVVGPVYLVVAASALSVWLGFAKDTTDLRPVTREQAADGELRDRDDV